MSSAPAVVSSRRLNWRPLLAPVLLVIASLLVGIVHVPQHKTLSPIDEYQYVDYLAKVPTQGLVHRGEEAGEYARTQLGCRGLRLLAPTPDDRCSRSVASDDARFPIDGKTSADIYSPAYFVITWVLAQPLTWFGVDLTDAGRFVGALWLAAAALLMFYALRRLRLPTPAAFGATLLIVGSLPAYWSNTYLSTDATALPAGALMLFLATLVDARGRGILWFSLGAAFVTLLKVQNLAAVAAAAIFLVIRAVIPAYRARSGRWSWIGATFRDRRTLSAIIGVVAAFIVQLAWLAVRSAVAVGPAPALDAPPPPLSITQLVGQAGSFLGGAASGVGDTGSVMRAPGLLIQLVTTWLAIAGVLGLLIVARWGRRRAALALATFIAVVVSAPILTIVTKLSLGTYPNPLPSRYGISLLPFSLACAALLFPKRRVPVAILAGLGVVVFAASLIVPAG
ncbi:hypothetical protein [Leifsonia shinshuensis]|uniref:hypothetical protein n=1 Tax=Leifsonia shinshuensis TaxID=150026 RepID=UPI0028577EDE|nr:hypothetical protein [Leifsonia shinshuensis]MDR6973253.1 hypothetical protein [Leifsonia shinshuensis]